MIRVEDGRLVYMHSPVWGAHWRYRAGKRRVYCDAEGCNAQIGVAGVENNGPVIDSIYLDGDGEGWVLGERDLCPEHSLPMSDEVAPNSKETP